MGPTIRIGQRVGVSRMRDFLQKIKNTLVIKFHRNNLKKKISPLNRYKVKQKYNQHIPQKTIELNSCSSRPDTT